MAQAQGRCLALPLSCAHTVSLISLAQWTSMYMGEIQLPVQILQIRLVLTPLGKETFSPLPTQMLCGVEQVMIIQMTLVTLPSRHVCRQHQQALSLPDMYSITILWLISLKLIFSPPGITKISKLFQNSKLAQLYHTEQYCFWETKSLLPLSNTILVYSVSWCDEPVLFHHVNIHESVSVVH